MRKETLVMSGRATSDDKERRVLLETQDKVDQTPLTEYKATEVYKDHKATKVLTKIKATREKKGDEELLAPWALRAHKAPKAKQEMKVSRACTVVLVHKEMLETLVFKVNRDPL